MKVEISVCLSKPLAQVLWEGPREQERWVSRACLLEWKNSRVLAYLLVGLLIFGFALFFNFDF